jgi:hypothetical protein
MSLVRLGYWFGDQSPGWPDVRAFIDADWDADERADVVSYLGRGLVARRYLGFSSCRICGQAVGSLELSDGVFIWPEGLAHYASEHSVRLPLRFVEHVAERTAELEEAVVDDRWWRGLSGWAEPGGSAVPRRGPYMPGREVGPG